MVCQVKKISILSGFFEGDDVNAEFKIDPVLIGQVDFAQAAVDTGEIHRRPPCLQRISQGGRSVIRRIPEVFFGKIVKQLMAEAPHQVLADLRHIVGKDGLAEALEIEPDFIDAGFVEHPGDQFIMLPLRPAQRFEAGFRTPVLNFIDTAEIPVHHLVGIGIGPILQQHPQIRKNGAVIAGGAEFQIIYQLLPQYRMRFTPSHQISQLLQSPEAFLAYLPGRVGKQDQPAPRAEYLAAFPDQLDLIFPRQLVQRFFADDQIDPVGFQALFNQFFQTDPAVDLLLDDGKALSHDLHNIGQVAGVAVDCQNLQIAEFGEDLMDETVIASPGHQVDQKLLRVIGVQAEELIDRFQVKFFFRPDQAGSEKYFLLFEEAFAEGAVVAGNLDLCPELLKGFLLEVIAELQLDALKTQLPDRTVPRDHTHGN